MISCSDKIEELFEEIDHKYRRKSSCQSKCFKSEEDKRARREVANNNERRRMRSINTGFQNLRKLLPFSGDSQKISKASILQSTAKYINELRNRINSLENEIIKLKSSDKPSFTTSTSKPSSTDSVKGSLSDRTTKANKSNQFPELSSFTNSTNLSSSLTSAMTNYLSSSSNSLKSCDENQNDLQMGLLEETNKLSQSQNSLEHLLAAVEQVERLEAMQTSFIDENSSNLFSTTDDIEQNGNDSSHLSALNFNVMKPTISPFAEKIIQDALRGSYSELTNSLSYYPSYITTNISKVPNEDEHLNIPIPYHYLDVFTQPDHCDMK